VGACVGVRGTRIKNIADELGGERIDIVRWNESLQVLIPNALQPAEIDEVMLCQLLGRAIVLVREDQLSLAIGRRGQNVRLASKLVGWDIEIMTSEELDELIEKAVGAFTRIDGVDTDLAEKLVEQGILSYDDLSVMEISDLVNTIEGLTEEQTMEIVARAETLAEEQAEELPRRKGARPTAPAVVAAEADGGEGVVASPGEARGARAARPTLDDLFGDDAALVGTGPGADDSDEESPDPDSEPTGTGDLDAGSEAEAEPDPDGLDLTASVKSDEIRDLILAEEESGADDDGHEVTAAPSDADQDETARIVTEAVEAGSSPQEIEANEAGGGRNVPPLPPREPFSTDRVEGKDAEMNQP